MPDADRRCAAATACGDNADHGLVEHMFGGRIVR